MSDTPAARILLLFSSLGPMVAKSPPPIVYIALGLLLLWGGHRAWRAGYLRWPPGISLPGLGSRAQDLLLTSGERTLFADSSPAAVAAAELIRQGNFRAAIPLLEMGLQNNRNDPEARIFLNNARAQQQGNPLSLAVVVPISSNPNRAKETLRGVAQAQEELFQQGGLGGRLLRVVIADDGDNPERAAAVAKALVGQPEILGVIGHNASDATLAAAEIYQSAGLAMISSTSTSTRISLLGNAIFRTVPSDQIAGTQLARYVLNKLRLQRVAIFYNPNSAYSTSLRDAFASTLTSEGGIVLATFDLTAADFNPQASLQSALEQGSQAAFLAPTASVAEQALAVARQNALLGQPLALVGGDVLFSLTTLKEGGAAVEGMVVAVPWHPDLLRSRGFAQKAAQMWGGQVSWRTALAYDATRVLLQAIRQGSPSRSGILTALGDSNFRLPDGASGEVRFLPSGDRDAPNVLVRIERGNRSGTGYDFVPLP
ncbi:ABC transporter substrate-binding protein [Synechococcus sp. H55.8]|uniref:ABC transporter substrate-binding protein n=1 Tax=Synechococcus sp. H55.8 TaxID=2964510 RepID=UPI0039C0B754